MIYFLLTSASFFNFLFYIFAIGFVIALILEQIVRRGGDDLDILIVTTNRKFCWRQAWLVNILWFLCNILLYLSTRAAAPVGSDIIWRGEL
jgi:hypothetical protein|tara:strand:- start:8697 stop:8969 length:273 start_codon:yes stop_codon:yes gene_type:complete